MYIFLSLMLLIIGIISLNLCFYLYYLGISVVLEWIMISLNSMEFIYMLMLDKISLLFMSFVMIISSMVIMYSHSYMSEDLNKNRFVLLVLLFVVSMMLMIISPNLFSILLGWDGLGLISFCLVIYFQNTKSNSAGMVTILSNRIGDGSLLLLLAWAMNLGSWNFYIYKFLDVNLSFKFIFGILLLLVGFTKSAQIPFSAWLPAAMAAPTPVSALVHSSTLVTAGVYLLIRFFDLLKVSGVLNILLFLGIMTMLMSGMSALFEFDFKKIIALSTLSQLGLMVTTLGLGFKYLSFFHLLTHAFFKALLFLCAGLLIHSFFNFQDLRYMGGLIKYIPMTFSCFMISNLSLMGMFFMSGFYSKDLILEFMSFSYLNFIVYILFYFCVMLTIFYSIRLMYLSYFNFNNFFMLMEFHDEDYFMILSMFVLTFMSVISGSLMKWMMGFTVKFLFLFKIMKFMVLYMLMFGVILGVVFLKMYKKLYNYMFMFYYNNYMWFLVMLTSLMFNYKFLYLGSMVIKLLDKGWIEYLIKFNLFSMLKLFINNLIYWQKNFIKVYLFMFILMIYFFVMVF